jgi:hypothetical protein
MGFAADWQLHLLLEQAPQINNPQALGPCSLLMSLQPCVERALELN